MFPASSNLSTGDFRAGSSAWNVPPRHVSPRRPRFNAVPTATANARRGGRRRHARVHCSPTSSTYLPPVTLAFHLLSTPNATQPANPDHSRRPSPTRSALDRTPARVHRDKSPIPMHAPARCAT